MIRTNSDKMFDQCLDFIARNTCVKCTIDLTGDLTAMWNGISLCEGQIFLNPDVADIGDFLHEVGHLVTVPMNIRSRLTGEIGNSESIVNELLQYGKSFDPIRTPSDDDAATYWAVCVCQTLGYNIRLPFENGYTTEFNREKREKDIREYTTIVQLHRSRFSVAAYYAGLLDKMPKVNCENKNPMIDRWDIEN
jgi:hypothetical protein